MAEYSGAMFQPDTLGGFAARAGRDAQRNWARHATADPEPMWIVGPRGGGRRLNPRYSEQVGRQREALHDFMVDVGEEEMNVGELRRLIGGADTPGDAPSFLGLAPGMTDLQKRTAIATGGLSENDPRFSDDATLEYFKNLVYKSVGKDLSDPTEIENQYVSQMSGFGPKLNKRTRSGFLSAVAGMKGR